MLQSDALTHLLSGKNAFVTGPAGAGKTYLLREFIKESKKCGKRVAVTASTGIAATHLEGKTLHSFAGIGVREDFDERMIALIARKHWVKLAIRRADVLIIDEVSMLQRSTFDAANRICKRVRDSAAPFGGMQVVLCGDFFQLPPVSNASANASVGFIYECDAWNELGLDVLYLTEQFRQTDNALHRLLMSLRAGDLTEYHVEQLTARINAELDSDVRPTRLHSHNANVDGINAAELARLGGKHQSFAMRTSGDDKATEALARGCLAPADLQLKRNAAVMFVRNGFSEGYVNGTLGTVVDFTPEGLPKVQVANGETLLAEPQTWELLDFDDKPIASITQVPLRLAWAITVHKSQGMSLSAAEIDLSRAFVAGLGYVALSRVTSFDGMRLLGFNAKALSVSRVAQEIDANLRSASVRIEQG